MSDGLAAGPMIPPFRLSTFGSVYLSRDGEILSGAAGQRRLLAILTILASVGERGMSRDKLLGLLWSEGEPDKSRHALTQSLYHIRKALGVERIFLSGADLRIDPAAMTSDVGDFQLALAQGRLADAVKVYRGPFLDGFYLNGDPDFEFWAATERDRLSRAFAQSLESLAREAHEAGDRQGEIQWRIRLADQDPLNGVAMAGLMTALAESGDQVGALQRGRWHEIRMQSELDLPPAPEVAELLVKLRRSTPTREVPSTETEDVLPSEHPSEALVSAPDAAAVSTIGVSVVPSDDRDAGITKRLKASSAAWIGFAATILVAIGALSASAWRLATARAADHEPVVAVAPFHVEASDASASYVREGLLELLGSRIALADGKRETDPSRVLRAARSTGFMNDGATTPTIADAVRLAKSLSVDEIVAGSIEPAPNGTVAIAATLVDVRKSQIAASVRVSGPPDSLTALVDKIVAGLILRESGDRSSSLPEPPSISPSALRDYVAGRAAYRLSDYNLALRAYGQALAEEPSFALAALGLAMSADKANSAEQHDRGVAIAWAHQASLPPADRAFLRAFAGPRYPQPSSASEILEAWRAVVRLAPDRADAWYELGESLYNDGEIIGMRDAAARSSEAFSRALQLDPSSGPSRRMLALLYARLRDTASLRRLVSSVPAADSSDALSVFVRWRVAHALGDSQEVRRVRAHLGDAPSGALRNIAMTSQFDGIDVPDGDRAIEILARRAITDGERVDVALARHSRALNRGDRVAANAIARDLESFPPGLHAGLRLRVLDALYSGDVPVSARREADALSDHLRAPSTASVADSAVRLADACVVGQWRLETGDVRGARDALAMLRAGGTPAFPVPVGASPSTCATLLDAAIAIESNAPTARERLAHLDSLMLSGPAVGDAMRYANLLVAREYRAAGDSRHALSALLRRSFGRGWPRYKETGLRLQIDLATELGDTAVVRAARERLIPTSR
jgi:DNA-binding SARP family transcriptional activator/TolB-like protein